MNEIYKRNLLNLFFPSVCMSVRAVSFRNHRKLLLQGFVHEPKKYRRAIIYLHGFPSTMDGGPKRFCAALSRKGFLCLRFNFSGVPPSEGNFERKLMSDEVKDIKAAVDFLQKNYALKKIVLVGHSTGAIDAALYAYKDKRLSGLVLSGCVSKLDEAVHYDFTDKQVRSFWEKGYIVYSKPGKYYTGKKLRKEFYDEFFTLNIEKAIRSYTRPLLVLHGERDEGVPVQNARAVYAYARKPKKLVIIKGADHRFTRGLRAAVDAIARFARSV